MASKYKGYMGRWVDINLNSRRVKDFPVSDEDIANYLGLAFETVGRIFKKLEQQGFIETRGRLTQLRNIPELAQVAGIEPVYLEAIHTGCTG